jgi:hypothetical protein
MEWSRYMSIWDTFALLIRFIFYLSRMPILTSSMDKYNALRVEYIKQIIYINIKISIGIPNYFKQKKWIIFVVINSMQ